MIFSAFLLLQEQLNERDSPCQHRNVAYIYPSARDIWRGPFVAVLAASAKQSASAFAKVNGDELRKKKNTGEMEHSLLDGSGD